MIENRWADGAGPSGDQLEELVTASRLIGAEESLVLWGGGNSSVKREETDYRGRRVEVLRVKGSGSDMKAVTVRDFAGVRLEDARHLRSYEALTDEDMVAYLAHCTMEPDGPRPSIETLLHAFLPAAAVLHSHADAILALVDAPEPEARVREVFGERVAVVPYLRPGFAMAKLAAEAAPPKPEAYGLVLLHHGLVTWGATSREAYDRHIALVQAAEAYLNQRKAEVTVARRARLPQAERRRLALRLAPLLRRELSAGGPVVLRFTDEEPVLAFSERPDVDRVSRIGVATPDHILHTKAFPVLIPARPEMTDAELAALTARAVASYRQAYQAYFERYNRGRFTSRNPEPVLALVPGVGLWAAGASPRYNRVPFDIYRHTVGVIEAAEALGGFRSLAEPDLFEVEYWPLELYKLSLRPPAPELTGRVALVTGAAAGIGAAVARRLAAAGAAVVVADRDGAGARAVAEEIVGQRGPDAALAVEMDVRDEAAVVAAVEAAIAGYGGLDILVSNAGTAPTGALVDLSRERWEASMQVNLTGHFLVTREALRWMVRQGLGGSLVYIVSKNALVPGREFGAYSVAKAGEAQLARIAAIEHGGDGIRVNMINPDAIWTGLWSPELRADRAQAYHITEAGLEDFYRRRSLLQRTVTAEDVAEAVLFFASERSAKTTGAILPVDSGIREGFPR